jgi:pyruvate kinase
MRRAKILATLGPATSSEASITALLEAGVNAVRINMSHGTREEHTEAIRRARLAAEHLGRPLAVLVDLSGPKIRTRELNDGHPVELKAGDTFTLTTRDIKGDSSVVSTNFLELPSVVSAGDTILIDDGAIKLIAESVTETEVVTRVEVGGQLKERKGINLPNTALPIPSMTEKDHADLEWAMAQNVDYIALSFVRKASDCREVKDLGSSSLTPAKWAGRCWLPRSKRPRRSKISTR